MSGDSAFYYGVQSVYLYRDITAICKLVISVSKEYNLLIKLASFQRNRYMRSYCLYLNNNGRKTGGHVCLVKEKII